MVFKTAHLKYIHNIINANLLYKVNLLLVHFWLHDVSVCLSDCRLSITRTMYCGKTVRRRGLAKVLSDRAITSLHRLSLNSKPNYISVCSGLAAILNESCCMQPLLSCTDYRIVS